MNAAIDIQPEQFFYSMKSGKQDVRFLTNDQLLTRIQECRKSGLKLAANVLEREAQSRGLQCPR